ncbi:hypothetical protein MKX03_033225 [Papaver bracteatum]|nr:hypothetical protein MKX03_033225 [Papaver bracteatum]
MAVVESKKGFELNLRKASGVPKENGVESDEEIRRVPEIGSEEPGPSISGRVGGGGREPGPNMVQASTTVGSTQKKNRKKSSSQRKQKAQKVAEE